LRSISRDVKSSVSGAHLLGRRRRVLEQRQRRQRRNRELGEQRPLLLLDDPLGARQRRRRRHDDERLALHLLHANLLDDVLALGVAISPMRRSSARSRLVPTMLTSALDAAPVRSIT
jgi:hypothetical protein